MATDQQRFEDAGEGLSRRQVLARGAVAAGIVWAAPVIRTASAYATSASGTERPCSKFYVVAIDKWGARPVFFPDPEQAYDEMPSASIRAKFRPVDEPAPTSTSTSSTSSTSTTSTSSTSSTSTTSTSSTSSTSTTSTSTTSTTRPFDDPTAGTGLFPGDEAVEDPVEKEKERKRKRNRNRRRRKRKLASSTTTTTTDPNADPATDPSLEPPPVSEFEGLGLFPSEDPVDDTAAVVSDVEFVDQLPNALADWLRSNDGVPVRYPEVPPMLTSSDAQAWAVLLPRVEDGPNPANHQCRSVNGWAKAGSEFGELYVDPAPVDIADEGLRLIFPNPTLDTAVPDLIDTLFLIYCCP